MEKELIFWILWALLYLTWGIALWVDIYKSRTIPHPFSWFVWLVMTGFNTYVLFFSKEYLWLISWLVNSIVLICWIIFGLKLFRNISINWFDYTCFWLSILLLIYYFLSKNVIHTVILTIVIDIIAYLPTIKKWWLQPWTETTLYYFLPGIAWILTVMALLNPSSETYLFWGYTFFSNILFTFMVLYRRWYIRGWESIFE